jgi:parallel beta-helix repeat protein
MMDRARVLAAFVAMVLCAAAWSSGATDANGAAVKDAGASAAVEVGTAAKVAEKPAPFDVNSLKTPAFRPPADEKNARLWALACAGVLMEKNGIRHDILRTGPEGQGNIEMQKELLKNWWSVENRPELISTLRWMEVDGHRAHFAADVERVKGGKAGMFEKLEEMSDKDRQKELKVVRENYQRLGDSALYGWDYSRYISLCRWGYTVGYISEDEAWERIMPVARLLQKKFKSWKDLGEDYIIGREYWGGGVDEQPLCVEALARLLESKNSPWVKLEWDTDLGSGPVMGEPWSKGRTITVGEDVNSIAEAMVKARANDTVRLNAGLYRESNIELKDGVRLLGAGMGRTVILADANDKTWVIRANRVRGRIEGLTVQHKGAAKVLRDSGGIQVVGSNVQVVECEAKGTSGYGIAVRKSIQSSVEDCYALDNKNCGILVKGGVGDSHVRGCLVKGNGHEGMVVACDANSVVERCIAVENGFHGMVISGDGRGQALMRTNKSYANKNAGLAAYQVRDATIEGNACFENEKSGIFVTRMAGTATISSNRCTDNKGSAISAYLANVEISGNVCSDNEGGISLQKAAKATITKNGISASTKTAAIYIMDVNDADVRENECIDNDNVGILVQGKTRAKVEDNKCKDGAHNGIAFDGSTGGAITHNWCEGNRGDGIYISKSDGGTRATGNRCMKNASDGISIDTVRNVSIKDNQVRENGSAGIKVHRGTQVKVDGNTCEENLVWGMVVSGSGTSVLAKWNKCFNNGEGGILFTGNNGGEASGNMCSENGWCGIGVKGAGTAPVLKANRCNDNGAWGIITWGGAKVRGLPGDNTAKGNFRGEVMEKVEPAADNQNEEKETPASEAVKGDPNK